MTLRSVHAVALLAMTVLVVTSAPVNSAPAADETAPSPAKTITWLDHDAALVAAREQERPLVLHFTADWCKWCKVMQQETYADAAVIDLMNKGFVTAKVDADQQPRLKARYGVQGLPTIWFLNSAAEPIVAIPGYVDAPTFLSVLEWIDSGAHARQTYDEFMKARG